MNIELSNRQPIIRRFKDIAGIATSHGAGIKKCLATMADKIGPATQIALTTFSPDESVVRKGALTGRKEDAEKLGRALAESLREGK